MRPDGETANDEHWQMLRAIAIDALLAQHRANVVRAADGHAALLPQAVAEAVYDACREELHKVVTLSHRLAHERVQHNLARPHRVDSADATRPTDVWDAAWVASGLASVTPCPRQLLLPARVAPTNHAQLATLPLPKAAPPPDPLPADTLVVYTDGSGPDRDATSQAAGWGYTVVSGGDGKADVHATELHSRCGRVVTDTQHASHIGAERATNNTAELSAIAHALECTSLQTSQGDQS